MWKLARVLLVLAVFHASSPSSPSFAACEALPSVHEIEPTGGPTSGYTNVSVSGSGFSPETPLWCVFGGVNVTATFHTSELLTCQSPFVTAAQNVGFALALGNGTEVSSGHRYLYYSEVIVRSVKPRSASVKGGTRVHVYGNFVGATSATGTYSCRFEGPSGVRVASGVRGCGDGGCVECYTPAWDRAEGAKVSVSLNRQQYSLPAGFAFKKEVYRFKSAQWIVVGCSVCAVVAVFGLVIVWVRHRRFIDGYDKIKEGDVEVDLRDIKMEDRIGRGTFGEVYKGTWRGAVVAVKRLNPMHMNEDFVREYEKEVYLMRALRAPNILQFLGSSFNPPDICIVMEYMSRGSLYGILHDPAVALDWPLLLRMLKDAARGMTYLHSCRPPIIHRDLKSHNLLVDEFWKVKVSDFGLSTVLEQVSQTMTACGTPCWTAPEVLRHQRYTVKADVYSFAVVMWECVTRSDVYVGIPPFKIIYAVSNQGLRPKIPSWVPEPFARLMARCWDENVEKRPDFASILTEVEEMAHFGWTGRPGPDIALDDHEGSAATGTAALDGDAGCGGATASAANGGGCGRDGTGGITTTPQAAADECDVARAPANPKFVAPSSSVIVSAVVPKKAQAGKAKQGAGTAGATVQSVVKKKGAGNAGKGGGNNGNINDGNGRNGERLPLISGGKGGDGRYRGDSGFFTSSSGSNLFANSSEFTGNSNSTLDSDSSTSISVKDSSFRDNDDGDDDDDEYY